MFPEYTLPLQCDFPLPTALQVALEYQYSASYPYSPIPSAPSSPAHSPDVVIDLPSSDAGLFTTNGSTSAGYASLETSGTDSGLNERRKGKRKRPVDNVASQQRRRNRRANMLPTERHARKKEWPAPAKVTTSLDCPNDLPVETTGFSGKNLGSWRPGAHWTIKELRDLGYEEIAWDGRQVFR